MLSVRDITYGHDGAEALLLDGCTFTVRPGEVMAVLGGRGSGKSTLACIVADIEHDYAGVVALGRRGREHQSVTLVGEDTMYRFAADIVADEVEHWLGEGGIVEPVLGRRMREALSLVGISHLADVKVRSLSHVETILVSLARLVAVRPRYVVIDGMDALASVGEGAEALGRTLDELRQRGSHVVLTTRLLSVAQLADSCVVLNEGHLVWSGEPRLLVEQDMLCEAACIGAAERRFLRDPDRMPSLGTVGVLSTEGKALELKGVSLKRAGITALDSIDVSARPGRMTLVVGHAGDGKSTLSLVAAGILHPDGGSVTLGGTKVCRGSVGLMPEDATRAFLKSDVSDDVERFLRARGVDADEVYERAKAALEEVGLGAEVLGRTVAELSAGERRLVGLACLVAAGYDALVLDEPTDGLDGSDAERVRELLHDLARRGVAVAVTSRDSIPWLGHVDDVVFLHEGEVVFSGSTDECVSSAMPWVRAALSVPRWLFDPQPPLGGVYGTTEGRALIDEDSGLRASETPSAGSTGRATPSTAVRASKGSEGAGRRRASVLRMRATRPHAKGHEGGMRTGQAAVVWAILIALLTIFLPWPALPLLALCAILTCLFSHLGVRDLLRLAVGAVPVLVVAFLVSMLPHLNHPSQGLLLALSVDVRLLLVVWLVGAVARVATATDVASVLCAPLALLRGFGADVDGWVLALARRFRRFALTLRELAAALACRQMREGVRRGHQVGLRELYALARERAKRETV